MDYISIYLKELLSLFNVVFPPNRLFCVHVYLFISISIKCHLAISLPCSDFLSLFPLTPETRHFKPLTHIKHTGLQLFVLLFSSCVYNCFNLAALRTCMAFLRGKHPHLLIFSPCVFW